MERNDLSSFGYETEVDEVNNSPAQSRFVNLGLLIKKLIFDHNIGSVGMQKIGYIVYGLSAHFNGNNNTGLTHLFYLAGLLELPESHMPRSSAKLWNEFEGQVEKVWCSPSPRSFENTKL